MSDYITLTLTRAEADRLDEALSWALEAMRMSRADHIDDSFGARALDDTINETEHLVEYLLDRIEEER